MRLPISAGGMCRGSTCCAWTERLAAEERAFLSEAATTLKSKSDSRFDTIRPDVSVRSPNTRGSTMSEECLEGPAGCDGPVGLHPSLSGSGEHYPRCQRHHGRYVQRVQPRIDDIRRRYPEFAPVGFDSAYAGEQWGEE